MKPHPSYNPPTVENWQYTHDFDEVYKEYYDLGYFDARAGRALHLEEMDFSQNPHKQELDFWYSEGVFDYEMREIERE